MRKSWDNRATKLRAAMSRNIPRKGKAGGRDVASFLINADASNAAAMIPPLLYLLNVLSSSLRRSYLILSGSWAVDSYILWLEGSVRA